MNVYEFAVLDAVNIATTLHRDHKRGRYQATVAEIGETLRNDERLIEAHGRQTRMANSAVQNHLIRLAGGRGADRMLGPLVMRVGTKKGKTLYALTTVGCRVLGA